MTDITRAALAIPFDAKDERTFVGRGGKSFTYVDDERVMDRLDEANVLWQIEVQQAIGEKAVKVRLGVLMPDTTDWLWYEDYGYPTNEGSDSEWLKEAVSDGIRRTGRMVGVARYLYRGDTRAPSEPQRSAPVVQNRPPATPAPTANGDGGSCPVHHKPWRTNSRGYYCASKLADGSWCKEQPPKAWAVANEVG